MADLLHSQHLPVVGVLKTIKEWNMKKVEKQNMYSDLLYVALASDLCYLFVVSNVFFSKRRK